MLKAEVQSLVALVLGGGQVVQSLVLGHGIPLASLLLVAEDIVRLGQDVQHNVHADNGEQLPVTAAVQRGIVYEAVSILAD